MEPKIQNLRSMHSFVWIYFIDLFNSSTDLSEPAVSAIKAG